MTAGSTSYEFMTNQRSGYTSDPSTGGGNIFVRNIGLNPLVNFNFMLRVEGVMDVPCKSVSAFTKENDYEYIREGGLNDYVHMKRKQISKPFTFTVERYVGIDYVDPLPLGGELILPVLLFVSRFGNRFDIVERAYTFTGCTVTAKEYGGLDAEKSGLLTERVTIAYRELLVVDTPGNLEDALDEIDGFNTKLKPRNAIYNVNEVRKKNMKQGIVETFEKFEFDDVAVPVRGLQEIRGVVEKTRDQMEGAAEKANKYKLKKGVAFRADKSESQPEIPPGGVEGRAIINPGEYRKKDMEQEAVIWDGKTPSRSMNAHRKIKYKPQRSLELEAEIYKFGGEAKRSMQKQRDMSDPSKDSNIEVAKKNTYKFGGEAKRSMQKQRDMSDPSKETNLAAGKENTYKYGGEAKKSMQKQRNMSDSSKASNIAAAKEYTYRFGSTPVRTMQIEHNVSDKTKKDMKASAEVWNGKPQKGMNKMLGKTYKSKKDMMDAAAEESYTFGGKAKRSMQKQKSIEEMTKSDMEGKAKDSNKYKIERNNTFIKSEGSGASGGVVGHANVNANEVRKNDMQRKAVKYEFKGSNGKANAVPLRSKLAPHEDERPTPRIWQPVKKK